MNLKRRLCRDLAITAVLSACLTGPALAQGASSLLEEIEVVARKKSDAEAIQDVPIAITAFSGDQIDAIFAKDLTDLGFTAPNVRLSGVGTIPGVQSFSIRGLGQQESVPTIDPAVGVFVDGMYLGVTFGALFDFFDLEGVEILRGPQGVLFGKNVTGGAVLLKSKKPTGEFGAKARVTLGSYDRRDFAASVEGPIIEGVLAAKFTTFFNDHDGYFPNNSPLAPVDDRGGESRTQLFKPTLLYTPTESFELSIIAEKGRIDSDGALSQLDAIQALGDFEFRQPFDSESEMDWQHIIGEANYDIAFGDGTITSIVSYREVKSNVENDDIQGSGVPAFIADAVTQQQQLTGELRYAGSFFEDFWNVTTGLFWLNDDIFYRERRRISGGAINVRLGGAQERWSAGVFVNNEFQLTPEVTFLGGIRYNAEYKEADACIQTPIAGAALATPTGDLACPSDFTDNDSWYNWSPKVGLQYQPTDDLQVYATWSKGFRSGGYSLRNNDPAFPPGPTEDEEQSAFEIGFKSDWFNNRVRLNVAAFYNEIEDLQRTVIFPGMAGTVQLITNAGDGTTKGVEVDATAAITENFVVQTSMGYLEDDYDEVIFDLNGDGMVTPADRDLEFPRAPRWTWYIGGTYDLPVTEWGTLTFNANYSFTDDFYTNDSNNASVKDAHLMNGSVTFTEISERFKLAGFVKNILNEDHAELAVQLGPALGGEQRYLNPPRTYGVELSYTYN